MAAGQCGRGLAAGIYWEDASVLMLPVGVGRGMGVGARGGDARTAERALVEAVLGGAWMRMRRGHAGARMPQTG